MWEPYHPPGSPNGMKSWAMLDGERSYIVSLDEKYPSLGYRASWSADGAPVFLEKPFKTLGAAKRALLAIRNGKAH
jgi:hypothetical protein